MYWNTGKLVGGDPLNNALLAAWGLLRGALGIDVSLMDGRRSVLAPAPQLEGATYTFGLLGVDVCVQVARGTLVQC